MWKAGKIAEQYMPYVTRANNIFIINMSSGQHIHIQITYISKDKTCALH